MRPADDHFGLLFTGYIRIPAAGNHSFYLNSDTGADFFPHDGHLIDDDKGHVGSVTSSAVNLSSAPPIPVVLWSTRFAGSDGTNRNLVNTNGDSSFTDSLAADDANLTFEDSTFTGTAFMHAGNMGTGTYYSPNTNVDNPGAAAPRNGGWWRSEFRYTGGSQTVQLSDIKFELVWSNSTGNVQTAGNSYGTSVRDITFTAEYSMDGGANWSNAASPQTYDVTEPDGEDQILFRTFTPSSPISVNHAVQDPWLRVKAENAGVTGGAYVKIKSIAFLGTAASTATDYTNWTQSYPGANLTDPNADLDGDGLTNDHERIWGLDPTTGTSPSPVTSGLNPATHIFTRTRRNPSLTGRAFSYEYSTSLSGWNPFTPASVTPSGASPVESVSVEVPAGLPAPRFFVRVVVAPGSP